MIHTLRFAWAAAVANRTSSVAVGAVIALGALLLTGLGALFETGLAQGDRGVLLLLPAILGSWAIAIVVFGVASVVAVTVEVSSADRALLRAIAATPRQIRHILTAQTLMVAVPAALVGVVPGLLFGRSLLNSLIDAGLVETSTSMSVRWIGVLIGCLTTLLAAVGASAIASARSSRVSPVRALIDTSTSVDGHLHRWRWAGGLLLILLGVMLSATTAMMPDGPTLSSTAGPAAVAVSVGLSLVAPVAFMPLQRLARGRGRAEILLAMHNAFTGRTRNGISTPVILLVGIATSTLAMQAIDDSAQSATGSAGVQLAPINYVVVAMLIGFTAILVVAGVVTTLQRRRREFGLLRIAVATRSQVVVMVSAETVMVTAVAVVLGGVAACAAIVPFALVRTGSVVAVDAVWAFLIVIVGAATIVALSTVAALASCLRPRPVSAVANA